MNTLKSLVTAITLLFCSPIVVAGPDTILADDYLFVRAQVIGCGERIRFVEAGQVTEHGRVTLFGDVELEAQGKTTDEVTSSFVDAWEERTGQRPKTIQIKKVSGDDSKTATRLMMLLYSERKRCGSGHKSVPPGGIDWQFEGRIAQVPSHNKSLKHNTSDAGAA